MFQIEHLESKKMTIAGTGVLKSLQDRETAILDIVVRESIQNSLDASLHNTKSTHVDFTISSFSNAILSKNLLGLSEGLQSTFKNDQCTSLIIQDKFTTGLQGKIENNELEYDSNFYNLVYGIYKAQSGSEAGGSYGLGKTIYFRVGIGLVLFYTHIYEDGVYKSRLAACFVEKEKDNKNRFLNPSENQSGIAWWGNLVGKNKTIPITDQRFIETFLQSINVPLYKSNETGTTIIIPYIDEDKLLKEVLPSSKEDNILAVWTNDLQSYLTTSIQRWYAPRLNNREYTKKFGNPHLLSKVNGVSISSISMHPYFKLIQNMYNVGLQGKTFIEDNKYDDFYSIIKYNDIKVNAVEKLVGRIVYLKFKPNDIDMNSILTPKIYHTNYIKSENIETRENTPIITFVRKPGMIINYVNEGPWVSSLPSTFKDEFLIAMFVLNSETTVKDLPGIKLEHYIRESEKADHRSWFDQAKNGKNIGIVEKIQTNSKKKIKDAYKDGVVKTDVTMNQSASHELASLLLPLSNFGDYVSSQKQEKTTKSKKTRVIAKLKTVKSTIDFTKIEYKNSNIYVPVKLEIPAMSTIELELTVAIDRDNLQANVWEDSSSKSGIGTIFPLSINSIEFTEDKDSSNRIIISKNGASSFTTSDSKIKEKVIFSKLTSKIHSVFYGIRANNNNNTTRTFYLDINVDNLDTSFKFNIVSTQEKGEK